MGIVARPNLPISLFLILTVSGIVLDPSWQAHRAARGAEPEGACSTFERLRAPPWMLICILFCRSYRNLHFVGHLWTGDKYHL